MRTSRLTVLAVTGAVAVAAVLIAGGVASPALAATTLTNPGFDANGASQTPTGWSESGTVAAAKSEAGGRSGGFQLAHWAASAYSVQTTQTLTGLTSGTYTLTAWVRGSGGQSAAYLALRSCGGSEVRANVPTTGTFTQVTLSASVTSSQCTVAIVSTANANNWINVDDMAFGPTGGGG